ncbi:MAG: hypothetical protein WAW13_04025 [Minisyncoccia bacterium]
MEKIPADNKKLLKELNTQLKELHVKLVKANELEGKNPYIDVKVKKNQARFQKITKKGEEDKATGKFFIEVVITAKQQDVFVPVSIASGKKAAGFMYQIEGTAPGSIVTTDIKTRGEGVSHVTLGTLLYAKIPAGKNATFLIYVTIRGALGKQYKIVFARLNYKLHLTDARYEQYLKEIHSDSVSFS